MWVRKLTWKWMFQRLHDLEEDVDMLRAVKHQLLRDLDERNAEIGKRIKELAHITEIANKTGQELAELRDKVNDNSHDVLEKAWERAQNGMTIFCDGCHGVDLHRVPTINGKYRCWECGRLVRDDNRQGMQVTHAVVDRFAENRVTAQRATQRARNFEAQMKVWETRALEGEELMDELLSAQTGHSPSYLSSSGQIVLNKMKRFLNRYRTHGSGPSSAQQAAEKQGARMQELEPRQPLSLAAGSPDDIVVDDITEDDIAEGEERKE